MKPTVMCTECQWYGKDDELTIPLAILDDDIPDYGGDCPKCGNHEVQDYDADELFTKEQQDAMHFASMI